MHMRDLDGRMRESKVRRDMRDAGRLLEQLLMLKQADFTACKGDLSPAPTVVKWRGILQKMREEGVPFKVTELALGGREVQALGVPPQRTAEVLSALLDDCLTDGTRNTPSWLSSRVKHYL